MSRHEFRNEEFELVVGVDNTTGPFLQVRLTSCEEPAIWIDNQGIRVHSEVPVCNALNAMMAEKFQDARENGNRFPNISEEHVIAYGRKLGFIGRSFQLKVYSIFD